MSEKQFSGWTCDALAEAVAEFTRLEAAMNIVRNNIRMHDGRGSDAYCSVVKKHCRSLIGRINALEFALEADAEELEETGGNAEEEKPDWLPREVVSFKPEGKN